MLLRLRLLDLMRVREVLEMSREGRQRITLQRVASTRKGSSAMERTETPAAFSQAMSLTFPLHPQSALCPCFELPRGLQPSRRSKQSLEL